MAGMTHLTRLRISRIGARIHDRMQEIGEPLAFAKRLTRPEPVRGLAVSLPFADSLPADMGFWSRIAERQLTIPVPESHAPKLRRAGVPLRYRGSLSAPAEVPRLEAHLHPFGVVAMTTVDLSWARPVPLDQVWPLVDEVEGRAATVTVADAERSTTLREAAVEAAQMLVKILTDPGRGEAWDPPPHRVVTVISGVIDEPPAAMPAANSPLHLALHRLSAGDQIVADPATAFVAQWSGAGYSWPATNLLYMLNRGTSLVPFQAAMAGPTGQEPSTADRHRQLSLLVAYLTASTGLVRAAQSSGSNLVHEWARTAAKRLGVLFGPGQAFIDWGLVPQALLLRTGATDTVAEVLGSPLTANPHYPVADYG